MDRFWGEAADADLVQRFLKDAVQSLAGEAVRVKDVVGGYRITEKMLGMIREARFVVAGLTDERSNVYFELGLCAWNRENVITIAREDTKIHLDDVYDWTCMSYIDSRPLEKELIDRFKLEMSR